MRTARPVLSLCQSVLRLGSLAEDVDGAAAAGFGVMQAEISSVDDIGVDRAALLFADARMTVSSLGGVVSDPLVRDDIEALNRSIEVAAMLGATVIGIRPGPLGELSHHQAATRTRDWFVEHGQRAAASGIVLALEPIHPLLRDHAWVHTLRHAASLVAGVEGAGLVVDIGHLWWDPDLVEDFRRHVDVVSLVQVTNVDNAGLRAERYVRAPLGQGDVRVAELVRAFHEAGYRGPYEHEVRMRMPRAERVTFVSAERAWFEANIG